jgi:hypothetical protein
MATKQKQAVKECKYRCERCDATFTTPRPGPVNCKVCGHTYVKWLNHKDFMTKPEERVP